ncbi:4'-phosphopantetheinyl transferase superfamily protein [Thermoleptolyngbya oregonensis NK1-22]|uniref:4'-phosphopantetheinyl transferase superfamily protein n=1 Tax=Thermoleptolyngbya oregonensis NK1-22 TaxID=2547457 RepID=A0AA97BMM7_9CYAN|nr:4'-phosphopantetheinyl transferase superfamily protein [Thermoleptolyngbya oregonensis NK1-22]
MSFTVPKIAAIAPTWLALSELKPLAPTDVHLWLVNIEGGAEALPLLEQTLSPDEQARATKFRQKSDRARFIIGRGILRHLLSRYTGLAPSAICFSYNSYGKPALMSSPSAALPLQFNLSHSGRLVLYGFTQEHPIGVDLEQHRPLDVLALARSVFSESERAVLNPLPPAEQLTQFLQLWTCKEAYVKATGRGLSGLEQVEMAIAPNGSICVPVFTDASPSDSYWQIQPMSLGNHFSSAFAVNKPAFNLYCYRLYAVQDLIQLISPSPTLG